MVLKMTPLWEYYVTECLERLLPEVPGKMCYVQGIIIQTHKKYTKHQVQEYNN